MTTNHLITWAKEALRTWHNTFQHYHSTEQRDWHEEYTRALYERLAKYEAQEQAWIDPCL